MTITDLQQPTEWPWEADLMSALDRRPQPVEALLHQLSADYPDLSLYDVTRCLETRGDVLCIDGGWVSLLAVADGAVLTHILTAEEQKAGVLVVEGDLDLWGRLADSGIGLAEGGDVRTRWVFGPSHIVHRGTHVLTGPPGWLDDYQPAQALVLRLQRGSLEVRALDTLPTLDEPDRARCIEICKHVFTKATKALKGYLAEEADETEETEETDWGPSVLLEDVIAEVLYYQPGLLNDPVPPLGAVLEDAGFEVRNGTVALPGVPPDDEADELDEIDIRALVAAHTLLLQLREGEVRHEGDVTLLLTALRFPVVAERLADTVELRPLPKEVTEVLLASASDAQRPAALLIAARSAEGQGDYEVAERLVSEAADQAPNLLPAVLDAAQYAAARGDVLRADGLLKRAGAPAGDPTRRAIRPLLSPPKGEVSRNRPCPCGSGRKYKACCLRSVKHPLPVRAQLAYTRLVIHAERPALLEQATRFASLVNREAFVLALDMAVFEAGVIENYLDTRGHALPADERALLESWARTRLAAYEVVDVQVGLSVTIRELLSSETVVLKDRSLSNQVRPLDVVQARLLWDGEKVGIFTPALKVDRMRRASLVDLMKDGYDPDELAAFWGPQPLPRLQNREGEDLVFCQATYDSSDKGAWDRLAEHLMEDEDGGRLLMVTELEDDEMLIQGAVRRTGDRWTLETNSVERFRELQRLFCDVVPAAVHVSESSTPAGDILDTAGSSPRPDTGAVQASDLTQEQETELLEEYIAEYEQKWLDMELPALGGRTPRTAATEGGEALSELQAMLDDMAWMRRERPDWGGMDADRLRTLLGISATRHVVSP